MIKSVMFWCLGMIESVMFWCLGMIESVGVSAGV